MSTCAGVRAVSESYIKPEYVIEESRKPYHLGSFELFPLSLCYIQTGLAFDKLPQKENGGVDLFLEKLKQSLSLTLTHFYPLAGRLVTEVDNDESYIYIDCNKGPGAKFVHATSDDIAMKDIVSATKVPTITREFFEMGRVPTNYDGHDEPLLSIQATELADGLFIGVSANHCVIDGTTFWHFLSSWSEIFGRNDISKPPSFDRWFPEGCGPIIRLPYTHPQEFITRYSPENDEPQLDQMVFHFSKESITALKEKANRGGVISSVQALSALLWRAIARARGFHCDESTTLIMIADARARVRPPLSPRNFGNFITCLTTSMKVEELLGSSFGCIALFLHQRVQELTDQVLRNEFVNWIRSPYIPSGALSDSNSVTTVSGVPRADFRDVEFGSIGKAVAVRTSSRKSSGRVKLMSGRQGRGSLSVELCLPPSAMNKFQQDPELASFLS